MVDTWTEKDEQEVLAMLARKAKLTNPDRRALVDVLSQVAVGLYVDPIADMLIERAAEFRSLLEPFDPLAQEAIRFTDVSGWTEWRGVPRPERANTRVEVEMRNGRRFKTAAGDAYWVHGDHEEPEDIMRYRVIS